jgi:hypothetical protein
MSSTSSTSSAPAATTATTKAAPVPSTSMPPKGVTQP